MGCGVSKTAPTPELPKNESKKEKYEANGKESHEENEKPELTPTKSYRNKTKPASPLSLPVSSATPHSQY